jgi:hypothetical protein
VKRSTVILAGLSAWAVLAPTAVWAAVGTFSSTTSTAAVSASNSYATGRGLNAVASSTSSSSHYGVVGSAAGTGGFGVYGSGPRFGVFSNGTLGVASGKTLSCTGCVRAPDVLVPAARVYATASISVGNTAVDAVPFAAESFDNAGIHDPASPTRLRAPVTGVYQLSGGVIWPFDGSGFDRSIEVVLNGTTPVAFMNQNTLAADNTDTAISTTTRLQAGDYVEVFVKQSNSQSQSRSTAMSNGCTWCSWFSMTFVSS